MCGGRAYVWFACVRVCVFMHTHVCVYVYVSAVQVHSVNERLLGCSFTRFETATDPVVHVQNFAWDLGEPPKGSSLTRVVTPAPSQVSPHARAHKYACKLRCTALSTQ